MNEETNTPTETVVIPTTANTEIEVSDTELDGIIAEYATPAKPETTNVVATETTNNTPAYTSDPDKFNAWEQFDELKGCPLPEKAKADGKTFFVKLEKEPEGTTDKITLILPLLNEKGFTVRSAASTRDLDPGDKFMIQNYFKKKFFLPFKKAGNGVTAETNTPTKKAYEIMLTVDKFFSKAPQNVRSFIANVSHLMLGKNLDQPLDFLLVYTPCGAKDLKSLDYKVTKTMYKEFRICEHYGVPIFNLKDPDCINDLKEFIKTKYLG